MDKKNIIIACNLHDSDIELLNRYKNEFSYEIICIKDLDDFNNYEFMLAFINAENAGESLKKAIKKTLEKYKGLIIVSGKLNNIFENPEKVRLEILKAYQKYIGIEKAAKPFSNRLKRLVVMIRLFETKKVITMDELIKFYHKNRRTILRDLSFLKNIGVEIEYDKEKKAYVLRKEYRPSI